VVHYLGGKAVQLDVEYSLINPQVLVLRDGSLQQPEPLPHCVGVAVLMEIAADQHMTPVRVAAVGLGLLDNQAQRPIRTFGQWNRAINRSE
jgi:hypothetical protein